MRNIATISAFAVLMPAIAAFLVYLERGSSPPQKRPDIATAIEMRLSIPEQYPSGSDLRQNDWGGPNHSIDIDNAIKRTLRDPDSFKFISATLWMQDLAS
jgi:hypothetical protein